MATECILTGSRVNVLSDCSCTCAQREGVVPHFVEVTVDTVEAELPFVNAVTAALPVSSASPVAVTYSISVTRSLGAP